MTKKTLELNNDLDALVKRNEVLVTENASMAGVLSSAKITITKLEEKETDFDRLK